MPKAKILSAFSTERRQITLRAAYSFAYFPEND